MSERQKPVVSSIVERRVARLSHGGRKQCGANRSNQRFRKGTTLTAAMISTNFSTVPVKIVRRGHRNDGN